MASVPEGADSSLGSVNCDLWHRFLPWKNSTVVGKVKAHTSLEEVAEAKIESDVFWATLWPISLQAMLHNCLLCLTTLSNS